MAYRADRDQHKQQQRVRDTKKGDLPLDLPRDVIARLTSAFEEYKRVVLAHRSNCDTAAAAAQVPDTQDPQSQQQTKGKKRPVDVGALLAQLIASGGNGKAQFVALSKMASALSDAGKDAASAAALESANFEVCQSAELACDVACEYLMHSGEQHTQLRAGCASLFNAVSTQVASRQAERLFAWFKSELAGICSGAEARVEHCSAVLTLISQLLDATVAIPHLSHPSMVELITSAFATTLALHLSKLQQLEHINEVVTEIAVNECDLVIKTFVLTCSRLPSAVGNFFSSVFNGSNTTKSLDDKKGPKELLQALIQICLQKWCSKSCLSSSGMAIAQILCLCGSAKSVAMLIQRVLTPVKITSMEQSAGTAGVSCLPVVSTESITVLHSPAGVLPLMSIIRGVVLVPPVTEDYLTLQIPLLEGERRSGTLLYDYVLPVALRVCKSVSVQFHAFFALMTLQACLVRLQKVISGISDLSEIGNKFLVSWDAFFKTVFVDTLDILWRHWNTPAANVLQQSQQNFTILMDLHRTIFPHAQGVPQFVLSLVQKILNLSGEHRAKYSPLRTLLSDITPTQMLQMCPHIVKTTLVSLGVFTVRLQASLFLDSFMEKMAKMHDRQFCEGQIISPLVSTLLSLAGKGDESFTRVAEHSLPVILRHMPQSIPNIVHAISISGAPHEAIVQTLISVLTYARSSDLVDSASLQTLVQAQTPFSFDSLLSECLSHTEEAVSLSALELITVSTKSLEAPTVAELQLMRTFMLLGSAHTTQNSRQKIAGLLPKFINRVRAATNTLSPVEQQVRAFSNWLADASVATLYPNACRERMLFALVSLSILVKSFPPDFKNKFFELYTPAKATLLLGALCTPVERCRLAIFGILQSFPQPLPGFGSIEGVKLMLQWAVHLIRSPRMFQADTGARLLCIVLTKLISGSSWDVQLTVDENSQWHISVTSLTAPQALPISAVAFSSQLIKALKSQMALASSNLIAAARQAPMHGLLAALRHIVDTTHFYAPSTSQERALLRTLLSDLCECIHKVSAIVLPVVADLAPEGYDPDVLSTENHEHSPDLRSEEGQLVTVCCWLCVKETSLLVGALVSLITCKTSEELLTVSQVKQLGELLLNVLLSTRHKGAIEKTAEGYKILCDKLLHSTSPELRLLPESWIRNVLTSLGSPQTQHITRRSAGMPFCIAGVLQAEAAEKGAVNYLLNMTIEQLLQLANPSETSESVQTAQVHAINMLTFLLRVKSVSDYVSSFLDRIFIIIFECFASPNWAIRNSVTMLFESALNRGVGVVSFNEIFSLYPLLYDYFLGFIHKLSDGVSSELLQPSMFSLLLLLSKLQPYDTTVTTKDPLPFIQMVLKCSAHPYMKVREVASAAIVPLVNPVSLPSMLTQLIQCLPDEIASGHSHNCTHGVILQIHALLQHSLDQASNQEFLSQVLGLLTPKMWLARCGGNSDSHYCFPISTAMLRLTDMICCHLKKISPLNGGLHDFLVFAAEIAYSAATIQPNSKYVGSSVMLCSHQKAATTFSLHITSDWPDISTSGKTLVDMLLYFLQHTSYDVRAVCLNFICKHHYWPSLSTPKDLEVARLLYSMVFHEPHLKCLKRVMYALGSIVKTDVVNRNDLFSFLKALALKEQALRPSIVVLMGHVVKGFLGCHHSVSENENLTFFLELVQSDSQPACPIPRRSSIVSALETIFVPSALCHFDHSDPCTIMSLAQVAITLLQDDDYEVRSHMARIIASSLGHTPLCPPVATEKLFSALTNWCLNVPPTSPENPSSAQHQWLAYLVNNICLSASNTPLFDSPYNNAQRLFEVEPDNFFSEEALLVQLSLQSLLTITQFTPEQQQQQQQHNAIKQELKTLVTPHLAKVIERLTTMTAWLQTTITTSIWPQWLTFEQEVFGAVYSVLTAPVLLKCAGPEDSAPLLVVVQECVGRLNSAGILHPVLQHTLWWLASVSGAPTEKLPPTGLSYLPGCFLLS